MQTPWFIVHIQDSWYYVETFNHKQNMQIQSMMLKLLFSVALVLGLTQCNSYDFSRRVVQQGNLLPHSKIKRLTIGMSKQETAILMGTSLLSPLFNESRWDYAYTWRRGNGPMEKRNVSLYFVHDKLARIEHHRAP